MGVTGKRPDRAAIKSCLSAPEVMPYAATGLGDVLELAAGSRRALPEVCIRVVMPLYSAIGEEWQQKMKDEAAFNLSLAWRRQYCGIKSYAAM